MLLRRDHEPFVLALQPLQEPAAACNPTRCDAQRSSLASKPSVSLLCCRCRRLQSRLSPPCPPAVGGGQGLPAPPTPSGPAGVPVDPLGLLQLQEYTGAPLSGLGAQPYHLEVDSQVGWPAWRVEICAGLPALLW